MRSPIQLQRPIIPLQELIGLLLYLCTFALLFGFFALRQDGDPEDCFAEVDNDTLLSA